MALPSINLYAATLIVATTGMRPGEVCGLQVTDIVRFGHPPMDRPGVWGEITVRHTNTADDGFRQRTKNDQIRTVPLGKLAVDALDMVERYWHIHVAVESRFGDCHTAEKSRQRKRLLADLAVVGGRREHGFVFLTIFGRPYNDVTLGAALRLFQTEIGFVKRDSEGRVIIGKAGKPLPKICFYGLRKMVATHNATRLPVSVAAAVTGHNEKTYLSVYVDGGPEDRKLIAASMGELDGMLRLPAPCNKTATGG
jgi:integrase